MLASRLSTALKFSRRFFVSSANTKKDVYHYLTNAFAATSCTACVVACVLPIVPLPAKVFFGCVGTAVAVVEYRNIHPGNIWTAACYLVLLCCVLFLIGAAMDEEVKLLYYTSSD